MASTGEILFLCAVGIACVFVVNLVVFHIEPLQPEPTSSLITTDITVGNFAFAMYPGENVLIMDSVTGYGYRYHKWFDNGLFLTGDTYEINYYCDRDGYRQIYSYVKKSSKSDDISKCIVKDGVCF
jgi:hypothetical protein